MGNQSKNDAEDDKKVDFRKRNNLAVKKSKAKKAKETAENRRILKKLQDRKTFYEISIKEKIKKIHAFKDEAEKRGLSEMIELKMAKQMNLAGETSEEESDDSDLDDVMASPIRELKDDHEDDDPRQLSSHSSTSILSQ